ncbi:MAG TPA: hypothetical protein VHZ01_00525 [Casimicrobiaceae bacterium]|jgi:hypothetical protein|nr:hypothetical protein [Casimicrobiaceae bacterium]
MHLNTEALVDIAEGTRPESAAPHLASCELCRAQVRELRAMMSAAQDVDVPEPSPLFWDHLSSRVSQAVAEDGARVPFFSFLRNARITRITQTRAFQASAFVAVMAMLIVVVLTPRTPAPSPAAIDAPAPGSVADADTSLDLIRDVTSDDDASLTVVASLTDDVDMDTAREAGLAPRGSAEHAVTHMSAGELRELGRLLQEELARSGA